VIITLLAAVAAQVALIACFVGAMSNPQLHQAPLALVVEPDAAQVVFQPSDAVSVRRYATEDAAREATRHGDVVAAVIVTERRETLLVAGASTPALAAAVTQVVQAQARQAGVPLQTTDVRPLPANDPKGLGTFLLTIGWVIGGYLGVMLLTRALGAGGRGPRGTARLLGWLLLYSVVSAVLAVGLVDPVMGVVTGHGWQLVGVGTLVVFSVGSFTAALLAVLGLPGLVIAIATLVVLGNPTSGGSVPDQMLAGGWRFLARVLPSNAAVRLVRSVQYFGGHHTGSPGAVLVVYAGAAVLLMTGHAVLARRRRPASAGEEDQAGRGGA
jgi:hypothetical protein